MRNWKTLFILVVLSAGCRVPPPEIVPVQGVVRLDGVPLNNVEVRFFPTMDGGGEYLAKAVTDQAGRYQLICKGRPGACACENRVIVLEPELPRHLRSENAQIKLAKYLESLGGRPLPPQYANLADSTLVVNVTAGQTEYPLELKR